MLKRIANDLGTSLSKKTKIAPPKVGQKGKGATGKGTAGRGVVSKHGANLKKKDTLAAADLANSLISKQFVISAPGIR